MNNYELNRLLESARKREEERRWAEAVEEAGWEGESKLAEIFKKDWLHPRLGPATIEDYIEFLRGYLKRGGQITDAIDRPFPAEKFYIAAEDLNFRVPLLGSQALDGIIVPAGIEVTGDFGHCHLYLMDGFVAIGNYVPVYSDIWF